MVKIYHCILINIQICNKMGVLKIVPIMVFALPINANANQDII